MTEAIKQPKAQPTPPVAETSERISKLKTAFLYVLIGGLAAAAITSVIALLIGHFNSALLKSLLTIFVFFTHALFILALLWADKYNHVGRKLLPTTFLVLAFSNLITTTLGTWELISATTAWRALGLYILVIGAVFIVIGTLRLRVAQQATQIAINTSVGLTAATTMALVPWVLQIATPLDPLYYRIVAALAILATTVFLISLILRGIAVGRTPKLRESAAATPATPGGLLAIYITIGTIAAFVWFFGFSAFVVNSVEASNPQPQRYERSRYS